MANIIKETNHLRKDIHREYYKIAGAIVIIAVCLIFLQETMYLSFIPIGMFIVYINAVWNNVSILKFGLEGEKEVFDLLKNLPKKYKVLSDVHIVDGKKSSQIDFVIIGPNGLFIMESKHIKGVITGNEEDTYLKKTKYGRSGEKYVKTMYNPIRQISGHKKGIEIFMKKHNIYHKAIPILYFSNDCNMKVKSNKVKVIHDPVLVIDYIKRHQERNERISERMQEKMVKELTKL